ncbi:Uncharacterised protein [Mycobacteroides abscessus subsp. abscessus]|nr:Uncharacterised protein [Mycobacteroides abscessus subsp. abscessus]
MPKPETSRPAVNRQLAQSGRAQLSERRVDNAVAVEHPDRWPTSPAACDVVTLAIPLHRD